MAYSELVVQVSSKKNEQLPNFPNFNSTNYSIWDALSENVREITAENVKEKLKDTIKKKWEEKPQDEVYTTIWFGKNVGEPFTTDLCATSIIALIKSVIRTFSTAFFGYQF